MLKLNEKYHFTLVIALGATPIFLTGCKDDEPDTPPKVLTCAKNERMYCTNFDFPAPTADRDVILFKRQGEDASGVECECFLDFFSFSECQGEEGVGWQRLPADTVPEAIPGIDEQICRPLDDSDRFCKCPGLVSCADAGVRFFEITEEMTSLLDERATLAARLSELDPIDDATESEQISIRISEIITSLDALFEEAELLQQQLGDQCQFEVAEQSSVEQPGVVAL